MFDDVLANLAFCICLFTNNNFALQPPTTAALFHHRAPLGAASHKMKFHRWSLNPGTTPLRYGMDRFASPAPETARRVQEARQFAELKAFGELLRQKNTFMHKVFHEIRTPHGPHFF